MIEQHWLSRRNPIVVARKVQDTARFGRLIINGDRILKFSEKAESGPGVINAGCYVLPHSALTRFPSNQAFSIEHDFWITAVSDLCVEAYISNGLFIDIGVPSDYLRAQTLLAGL